MTDRSLTSVGTFTEGATRAPNFSNGFMSLFSLKGRTALISGSSSGIGLEVARCLAEAGANVAITCLVNDVAPRHAAEIEKKYGVICKSYKLNVHSYENVESVINQAVSDMNGRLDIVVANAGIPWTQGPIEDGSLDHYHAVMKTNVDGVFYCARVASSIWKRQKLEGTDINGNRLENYNGGVFVATSSMSGHIVNIPQIQSAYNASKAAVRHLISSLGVEWAGFARANSVSPGYMATEISDFIPADTKSIWKSKTPMGREGDPRELCGAYLYLCSDASSFTTGTDITVDGGYCLP